MDVPAKESGACARTMKKIVMYSVATLRKARTFGKVLEGAQGHRVTAHCRLQRAKETLRQRGEAIAAVHIDRREGGEAAKEAVRQRGEAPAPPHADRGEAGEPAKTRNRQLLQPCLHAQLLRRRRVERAHPLPPRLRRVRVTVP